MKVSSLILILFLIAGCRTSTIVVPDAYDYSVKDVKTNPFGYWTKVVSQTPVDSVAGVSIAGELIAMDWRYMYLLVEDGLVIEIAVDKIVEAELYTHKNQAGNYMVATGLLLIPNIVGAIFQSEYAGGYLALGIPTAVFGVSTALIESRGNNVLSYPKRDLLKKFQPFARFPGGLPSSVDFKMLELQR